MPLVATDTVDRLEEAIKQSQRAFHRLVLLVGPSGTGKTGVLRQVAEIRGCPYLNINLHLSQRMLELPRNRRSRQVDRIFKTLLAEHPGDVIVLDNLEILFDLSLAIDPLRLLKSVSRRQTLVAAWSGKFRDDTLTYAEPDHPEFKSYRDVDVLVVPVPTETTAHD